MKAVLLIILVLTIFTPSLAQCGCGGHHEEDLNEDHSEEGLQASEYETQEASDSDDSAASEYQGFDDEDEDDYGREITLFYSYAHSNSEKFIDAFMAAECKTACSDLGYSQGHKWNELCESECEDFKSEMAAGGEYQKHYDGGCGCGGGSASEHPEYEELEDQGFGTCGSQPTDDHSSCSAGVEMIQEDQKVDL